MAPLIDSASPEAHSQNVATEVKAKKAEGYSTKKAVEIATAIAYDVQRRAAAKSRRRKRG